ncbi:glycosyltransferase [Methyloversatilis sp. NSM2]|uniref:glycosyltransferase n=1 Tax=Methyloversatilis sp. NSM2 TaxID=3134135 RepID=UPI0031185C9B
MSRVAVCLAAFNGMSWLPEQVDSILHQRGVTVDLFISVDRSSDGTEEWCETLAASDGRVHVLPSGRVFGGAAPNFFRLILEAPIEQADFVALADQDDIWFEDKLARAVGVIQKEGADAYSGDVIAMWASGQRQQIRKSQAQRESDFIFESAGPGCTFVLRSSLVRALREVLQRHRSDLGRVGYHDWLIYAFARSRGARWIIDDTPKMFYRQHAHNLVGVNQGFRALVRRLPMLFNGEALAQVLQIMRILGLQAHPVVARLLADRPADWFWLALRSGQCRRRARDRMVFAVYCVVQGLMRMTGLRRFAVER